MKALVGAFNQEKALVGAFSVIVQPVVEPMEHYTALAATLSFCPKDTMFTDSIELKSLLCPKYIFMNCMDE